ncbi:hypothetical protein GQ600_6462 [Phytophthora cactorum]|nr:hypothetical protein GQ600_6462 [Phytophthora cactorum]
MASDANSGPRTPAADLPVRPRTLGAEFEEVDDSSDALDDIDEDASDAAIVDSRLPSAADEEMKDDPGAPDRPDEVSIIPFTARGLPNLYDGTSGPTTKALAAATTPSGAFFYCMQLDLWESIAVKSNDYFAANIDERVEGQYAKQIARQQKNPGYTDKSKESLRAELLKSPDITARELCVFVGLLVARFSAPTMKSS